MVFKNPAVNKKHFTSIVYITKNFKLCILLITLTQILVDH